MATKRVQKAAEDKPERFRMGELGYSGLNIFDGVSRDELKRELSWPHSVKTFKQMSYHSTITSALTLFDNIIGKVDFKVSPPPAATEEEIQQCKRIEEMMHDMEHSFPDFIKDTLSMNVYGFSVHEKVFRRRLRENGSKFSDGCGGR